MALEKVEILHNGKKTGDRGREDGIFAKLTCVQQIAFKRLANTFIF